MNNKIVIGVADCEKFANYERWMLAEQDVEVIQIGYHFPNNEIKKCHGILLTGGNDVHPRAYHQPEYIEWCEDDFDQQRDEFEWNALAFSQKNNLPVLGICRGLQIANVFFGGTLIPDLPMFGKFNHSKFLEGKDKYHSVALDQNSLLQTITKVEHGEVNSAHHQSVDRVGKGLVASAVSPDGVIEAIERKNPSLHPFLVLVQWHPERMLDQTHPLAKNIKQSFLESMRRK